MKNSIKLARIGLFSVLLLMLSGYVIAEYADSVKIRTVLFAIAVLTVTILAVILMKSQKCAVSGITILDLLNAVIFIGLLVIFGRGLLEADKVQNTFHGDNEFLSSYSKSIGGKSYDDLESAVADAIEYREASLGQGGAEEIYRIQEQDKVFVYFKETEDIVEIEFFRQDDLYYRLGSKVLVYGGAGDGTDNTIEETIKKDIVNTMWRGVGNKEVSGPAWGVSCDGQIYALTVNGQKMEEVIEIDEKDGKKYYFWLISDVGEIAAIEDVSGLKLGYGGLQRDKNM